MPRGARLDAPGTLHHVMRKIRSALSKIEKEKDVK
jgi:hypothetical protein